MTIEGEVGGIYYTKSGYLIRTDMIDQIVVTEYDADYSPTVVSTTSIDTSSWTKIAEERLDEYIHNPQRFEVKVIIKNDEAGSNITEISNRDGRVEVDTGTGGAVIKFWDDAQSAVEYYVDSFIFSKWVEESLGRNTRKRFNNSRLFCFRYKRYSTAIY